MLKVRKSKHVKEKEGTHEGGWIGIKPTHKKLVFIGVDIDKVINGKIVNMAVTLMHLKHCLNMT